jgi:hypothetical protein
MSVEIHEPQIEALIELRMASGAFQNVEEVLIQALTSAPLPPVNGPAQHESKSLAQLFAESPFKGTEMEFPRDKTPLRPIDL